MTSAPSEPGQPDRDDRPHLRAVPDQGPGRVPPQDTAAEQCVLGAMMLSKDAIADIIELGITTTDYYQPRHGIIHDTILDLYGRGEPADIRTTAAALIDSGDIGRIPGGATYLADCVEAVPTAANGAWYARIVINTARERGLIDAGTLVAKEGWSPGDIDDRVDRAQQAVYDLTEGRRSTSDAFALADLLQPTLDEVEAIAGHDGSMRGVPTGFTDLDKLLNGLQDGQLIVIAGRPGLGKSTIALDWLRSCTIRNSLPAVMFSLEMSKVEVVMRLLSAEARVPLHSIRSGELTDGDWTKMGRRMGEISEAPLYIDDNANMTLMEIRAKARRLKQQHGIRMIVVDYMQLMSSGRRSESRQQEVSEISRGLKLLAKELECPVIALSQLNRGPEQRTDKRPQLSDLRESGSIEQDADVVLLLHREDYYDKESQRAGEADFIVAKHRNGPTDTVVVASQLHLSRFVDMAIS